MVRQTVVAPASRARATASRVSCVSPECEIATATSPGPSRAALIACIWLSEEKTLWKPIRRKR